MGLQRVGDGDPQRLLTQLADWVGGSPLVRRAAVAESASRGCCAIRPSPPMH
jgi:hypothetical protein